jgi:hypothetical protein
MTRRIRKLFTFPIDDELSCGLRFLKERDGISIAEQLRRAIVLWLKSQGVIKAERKRAAIRERPATER